ILKMTRLAIALLEIPRVVPAADGSVSSRSEEHMETTGTERCEDCGRDVAPYDAVCLSLSENKTRLVCTRCFNTIIAKQAGVDFEHPVFAPIVLEDASGERHEFHFRTHHGGAHIALEAFEIEDGSPCGYEFQVLGEPDTD